VAKAVADWIEVKIDSAEVQRALEKLLNRVSWLHDVNWRIGGYARYSAWLELGTAKKAARPHIFPAITANAETITSQLAQELGGMLNVSTLFDRKKVDSAFIRATRQAVAAAKKKPCPYKTGFHRRSIRARTDKKPDTPIPASEESAYKAKRKG